MSSQSADVEHRLAEEQYFPVLTGTVLDGHEIETVVVDLADLLQIPEEKAADLLQGKPSRLRKRLGKKKADQIRETGAKIVATNCFNCMTQIRDLSKEYELGVEIKSIVELISESLIM